MKKSVSYYIKFMHGDILCSMMAFTPEEVEPYYDIYDDGRILVYVTKKTKKVFGLYTHSDTYTVSADNIRIVENEIPERRICGE